MNKKVLITGVGGVGTFAAHLLAAVPGVDLYLGDIRENYIKSKANCIFDTVFFQGGHKKLSRVYPVKMDLMDFEDTKRALMEIQPDVILHLASLLAAVTIRNSVPEDLVNRIYNANPEGTGLRPWAPGQAVFIYNLMKAINETGIITHVVNASGCDYLHVALHNIGIAPTCGLGDFALLEPPIVQIVSQKTGCYPGDVKVHLAGHHSLCMPIALEGRTPAIPYYIKISVSGEDITGGFDIEKDIFANIPKYCGWPLDAGSSDQEQTAAHAVKIVKAILFDTGESMNIPGPEGLPGCYPCRAWADGVKVVSPKGITKNELIRINEAGNLAEGFGEIRNDGSIVATEKTVELVEEIFKIEWKYKEFRLDEAYDAYKEIREALYIIVAKYHG